jgi:CDP-diacylglycerol--glycerol-3-phosphate 3-phosphatidyltransferase
MNIPNALTVLRIALVPTYMVLLYKNTVCGNILATCFFVLASFTDLLDGYIARKYKLVTNFGKVMDPAADKIMVTAAMVVLVDLDRLAAWIVVVMLFRDFAVGALRDVASSQGTIIAAGIWGKLKTTLQMVALSLIILQLEIPVLPVISLNTHLLGTVVMYVALVASIFSGIIYFRQYIGIMRR